VSSADEVKVQLHLRLTLAELHLFYCLSVSRWPSSEMFFLLSQSPATEIRNRNPTEQAATDPRLTGADTDTGYLLRYH